MKKLKLLFVVNIKASVFISCNKDDNTPTDETFTLNIRGIKVVITIEPKTDNNALTPFLLNQLNLDVSFTADVASATHSYAQNLGSFLTGSATR